MDLRVFATRHEMEKAHREDVNKFPMFFAFDDAQFNKGMEKFNLDGNNKEDIAKITSIGAGGYILKKDIRAFKEMFDRQHKEEALFTKNYKNLVETIEDVMYDHEYNYTEDDEDILQYLTQYRTNPLFNKAWEKAKKNVLSGKVRRKIKKTEDNKSVEKIIGEGKNTYRVSNNLHKILVIAADTPLLALKKFYQNEDLQIVKVDEKDANVKVELLSGQRKTKNFYFVKG